MLAIIQRSLFNQLVTAVLAGTLLTLAVLVFYFISIQNLKTETDQDKADAYFLERDITGMVVDFKIQVQEWKNVLLRGYDLEQREKYWQRFQQREQTIQENLARVIPPLPEGNVKSLLTEFQSSHAAMGTAYRRGFNEFVAANADPKVGDKAVSGIDRAPTKTLQNAADEVAIVYEATLAEANEAFSETLLSAGVVILLVLLASAGLTLWLVSSRIVRPTQERIGHLSRMAEGELVEIPSTEREDELGKLTMATHSLRGFLIAIADNLRLTSEGLDENINTINGATQNIGDMAEEAKDRTQQVATATQEMAASAQEVTQNANSAATASSDTDTTSQEGMAAMGRANDAIQKLASQIGESRDSLATLSSATENVGTVLQVIRGIAEQTNLLALNAAIEAARAGEQGRGFAVVADEVRSLAQKTQLSTEEIEKILHNVQAGAKNTVGVMETSQVISDECQTYFQEANEKLQAIGTSVAEISRLNSQVAVASDEQLRVTEEIAENLQDISARIENVSEDANQARERMSSLVTIGESAKSLSSRLRVS